MNWELAVRSDIAVKLYGDDLDTLAAKATEIERVLLDVPGSADVGATQLTGQPMLQVKIKQNEIARYGVPASSVLDLGRSRWQSPGRRRISRPASVSANGATSR